MTHHHGTEPLCRADPSRDPRGQHCAAAEPQPPAPYPHRSLSNRNNRNHDRRYVELFVVEAKIHLGLQHPNIVLIEGVCMQAMPRLVVLEYCMCARHLACMPFFCHFFGPIPAVVSRSGLTQRSQCDNTFQACMDEAWMSRVCTTLYHPVPPCTTLYSVRIIGCGLVLAI